MTTTIAQPVDAVEAGAVQAGENAGTRKQIRGSSLLFVGRLLSMGVNFVVHVLIVRYLSKSDYGAFAYALAMVKLGESISDFGLHRAVNRFVPIYHEQQDYKKAFGTIVLAVGVVVSLGLAAALAVYCFQGTIARSLISDQQAVTLLLILIFLSPVEALDRLMVSLFAVFADPRAIFFRRYVVGPGLKLAVVLMLIGGQCSVLFLAAGYLAAGTLGVGIYTVVLVRLLRAQGVLEHFNLRKLEIPWAEVLLFTTPLLTTDLVHMLMSVLDAVLLGYYGGTEDVAAFRAVQPTAKLNQLVFTTFGLLFTPQAARLFARDDREGINHLYWQTAAWIAVMTFPVFVLTFSLAQPLTVVLFGARYEQSAPILALLSFGYYFNAALGFNGTTLTIVGKVRYVVCLNLVVAAVNVAAYLILIPRYGALGAAIGACGALTLHNVLKQTGLMFGTSINFFEWRYLRVYVIIAIGAVALMAGQLLAAIPFYVSFPCAVTVSLLVVRLNRDLLDIEKTFPELMKLPLMPWLLGK